VIYAAQYNLTDAIVQTKMPMLRILIHKYISIEFVQKSDAASRPVFERYHAKSNNNTLGLNRDGVR
jgi:hypothetical protein